MYNLPAFSAFLIFLNSSSDRNCHKCGCLNPKATYHFRNHSLDLPWSLLNQQENIQKTFSAAAAPPPPAAATTTPHQHHFEVFILRLKRFVLF
eukprot:767858-Hanusia_phi.AAC.2